MKHDGLKPLKRLCQTKKEIYVEYCHWIVSFEWFEPILFHLLNKWNMMGSNHSNDTAKLNGESRRVNLGSDRSPMAATTVPLKECWKIATAYKYELLDERTIKRGHLWAAFALQWDLTPVSVWWSSGLGRGSRWPRHNQQDPRRRPWVMSEK